MRLTEALSALGESDQLPLHMPGHKRRALIPGMKDIYRLDITEIDGFDDMHYPTGMIKDMLKRAAMLYGADRAWISVNGSTLAVEAAILGACLPGEEIICARGSHQSVYYAIELGRLVPVYISQGVSGDTGEILPPLPEEIDGICSEHPSARCVVVTSPTYDGLIADIDRIADIVHGHGMILIVDSAHGAHIGVSASGGAFGNKHIKGALEAGADIAAISLHKMLPAPTQTALLLMRRGEGLTSETEARIDHYMHVLQSSSPSYILMCGIDECLHYMEHGFADDLRRAVKMARQFAERTGNLKSMEILPCADGCRGMKRTDVQFVRDPFKILIVSGYADVSGRDLYMGLLNDYHIQCEMCSERYALALFSVADRQEDFDRLADALKRMDAESVGGRAKDTRIEADRPAVMPDAMMHIPERRMIISDATAVSSRRIAWGHEAEGRVSAGYISIYPPGIPVAVPGEIIDRDMIEYTDKGLEMGLNVRGIADGMIAVLEDQ